MDVGPTRLNGVEYWKDKKKHTYFKMNVVKIKMLRSMSGKTRKIRIKMNSIARADSVQ